MAESAAVPGAVLKLPPQGVGAVLDEGLEPLFRRGLVRADLQPLPGARPLMDFYAASVPEVRAAATRRT